MIIKTGLFKNILRGLNRSCFVAMHNQVRFHGVAKGKKHKGHEKKPPQNARNHGEAGGLFDLGKHSLKMDECVSKFREEMAGMRVGQASASLLDNVRVISGGGEYSGKPISQLARIIVRDQQTLQVIVHDPAMLKVIDKSIRGAGLNLNPQIQDQVIQVPVPKPTQEYRQQLSRQISQLAENAKIRLRKLRQEARDNYKKHGKQSIEDDRRMEKQIQDLTESHVRTIEELSKQKSRQVTSQ